MNGVMSSVRCGAVLAALVAVPGAGVAVAQVSVDAFASVPANEIPGQQIGWFVNRSFDAFVAAVEQQKPLILVFGELKSNLTQKFAVHVTPCPHLNQLAGIAVFAYGSPVVDERARKMASDLKIADYPTISVIAPRTDKLTEIYRMEGFFDAESIGNDLQRGPDQGGILAIKSGATGQTSESRIGLSRPGLHLGRREASRHRRRRRAAAVSRLAADHSGSRPGRRTWVWSGA